MEYIPLIYFGGLTFYFWQRNRSFDLSVYISLLFTITSLCCVLMVMGGHLSGSGVLTDGWMPEFSILPTVLYCGLITLTILPFSFIRTEKLVNITNVHRRTIFALSIFIIIQGLLIYYVVLGSISELLSGDFKYIKDAGYAGDITPADAKMLTMPLPAQLMYLMTSMTLLGIPLFFYYSCIEKRSLWLTVPLLAVSLSPVLRGILAADRTEIIHYGLMFLFTLVFFKGFLTTKVRNFFLIVSVPILMIGTTYIVAVSASRFEDSQEGASGSMLEYAGQSYANFCYFYDNHNRDLFYFEREIPVTTYFLSKEQYADTKEERSAKEGFFIGVFASHIGSWMLDTGVVGSCIISALFFLVCCLVIRNFNRTEFDIADVMMIFVLGAVPTFGIFYYRYYSIGTAFIYVAAGALFLFSKLKIIWKKDDKEPQENNEQPNEKILLSDTP